MLAGWETPLLAAATLLEGMGVAAVIAGGDNCGGAMLQLFLLFVTPMMHPFWAMAGDQQKVEMVSFVKNLCIIGALTVLRSSDPKRRSAKTGKTD